jgi:hypothetical protein
MTLRPIEETTPKDERVLDAIKNDALIEEAIASAELAQPPKDERTWEDWVRVLANSKNPHDVDLLIAKIKVLLHTHTTALAEEIERKVVELFLDCELRNYRVEHTDVVAIIRSTLTPPTP